MTMTFTVQLHLEHKLYLPLDLRRAKRKIVAKTFHLNILTVESIHIWIIWLESALKMFIYIND